MFHKTELIHRQIGVLNRVFVGFLTFSMKSNSATLLQLSEYTTTNWSFKHNDFEGLSKNTMVTIG